MTPSPPDTQRPKVPIPALQHLHAIDLPTPFPVGPVTVYLADAPGEPPTLVDTGPHTPATREALQSGLAQLGYAPADLARILITHAHVDHFGLAAHLVTASSAQVVSHLRNVATLGDYDGDGKRRATFYVGLMEEAAVPREIMAAVGQATQGMQRFARPVSVDVALGEGDCLRLAGRDWRVLHTPGHAGGLICLYEPASQTLLSSDHLLATISSNPVVEPPLADQTERPRSLALYKASLQRVAAMAIDLALPGHGPRIRDVPGLVSERLQFHQRRSNRVMEAVARGAHTTWEVTARLFPSRSPLDTFLAVSEVIGHLDLLEMEGKIVGESANGIRLWQLAEA